MLNNFDEVVNRRNTYSVKWDGGKLIKEMGLTERYDEETIPLFTADMDLPVPQALVDALHKTVENRIYGYSIFPDEYYKAIQHWFKKRHDWDIDKDHIVYSPGTVHAINMAIRAYTEPNDGIIIQRPAYPPFTTAIEGNGRTVLNNALLYDEQSYYTIDFADFEEKASQDSTKMFILCNPHNPTGRIFREDELKRLAEICKKHQVLIVADEIHGDLIRKNEKFIPMAKIADNEMLITCTAINKTFNVAGLHCTNMVIPNLKLRKQFIKTMGHQMTSPFTISALIAVYNDGEEWLEDLKTYIDGTMEMVKEFIDKKMPKVKVVIPEGTYIMWLDFSAYNITPEEVHDRIYNRANVLLEDGSMFGEEGTAFQRICIPSPRSLIQTALDRIAKEFEDLQ
ncbi:MalY/PatB family protein [Niallia sp. MER 6]|uniref:MalY/PatB family protein n=1 Tax=Niallia sp. MER 6 TaxID=2939567 RepID=UPI00203EDE02|nr:MalY/PatB family protein [Niallia sp. MER 6]MCM3031222.1 pyridoxal phosphate-dependent aminotransferase [Niallia sp. MER 6]